MKFLEDNYNILIEHGAEDFDFFLEIYYSGDQCNFEVFDKEMLGRIKNYIVSIPISIYHLKETQIEELLKK